VFGRVSIPEELRGKGFAADFEPHQREYSGCFPAAGDAWGIGANMSLRRTLVDRIGKFDPFLGPGAPFNAGEETDLAIRALAAGFKIVNAAEVAVLHLGVRESDDASTLMRGYGQAVGAAFAKHVRLGTQESGSLLVSWVTHFGVKGLRNAVLGRHPPGSGWFLEYCGVRLDRSHSRSTRVGPIYDARFMKAAGAPSNPRSHVGRSEHVGRRGSSSGRRSASWGVLRPDATRA
jgi:hypothetical protein